MVLTEQELVTQVAFISMLVAFIQVDITTNADNLQAVENVASLLKAILELVGEPLSLKSFSMLWRCGTEALLDMENQYFPDLPTETPRHLVAPNHPLPLTYLNMSDWNQHVPRIQPGFMALVAIKKWLEANYSSEVHDDIFHYLDDSILLLKAVADICGHELRFRDEFLA